MERINPQLTATAATAIAEVLIANERVSFIGTTKKAPLAIVEPMALGFLAAPNPTGTTTSDVVLPWMNGLQLTRRDLPRWIVDFPNGMDQAEAAGYAEPFGYVEREVRPVRVNHREAVQAKYWWRQAVAVRTEVRA